MQSHFLMFPPCDCIAKIVNNFMKGRHLRIRSRDLGGMDDSFFSVLEKKRDERCWSKVGDGEVGVKRKNVPYTQNFFPLQ